MVSRLRVASAVALLLAGGCQASPDIVAESSGDYNPQRPPVIRSIDSVALTDPFAFHWHDTYWVFSTGPRISVYSSKDLSTFRQEKPVFAENPAWIANTMSGVTDLWCPDVHVWNGTIHLYYVASAFNIKSACIGHATASATSSELRFVDSGQPVICTNVNGNTDDYTAVDPAVILKTADEPWMAFGSFQSGIKLIALDRNGGRLDTQMYSIAARPAGIQAVSLYRWRDYYYLFASFDNQPNHSLHVGRATDLKGPYLDQDGHSMLNGGGTLLLAANDRFKGPGSNMVLDCDGQHFNVYHAYDANLGGTAVLRVTELFFNNDGWPVTAGP
jgi:arabinan endo-1,5-alpha-L-arabinosidase